MNVSMVPEETAVILTAVNDVIPHGTDELGPRLGNQARKVGKTAEFVAEPRQIIPDHRFPLVKLPVLDSQEEVPARRRRLDACLPVQPRAGAFLYPAGL